MIDIETTGTDKILDDILEVGVVETVMEAGFIVPTGKIFHSLLHNKREPQTEFAKKYMAPLYKRCNEVSEDRTCELVSQELRTWLHGETFMRDEEITYALPKPKKWIGHNASGFDLPFMFEKNILQPSYHKRVAEGKEELFGDVHYRIYEQAGALQLAIDVTGLDRKTVHALAMDLAPNIFKMPEGEDHDAIYDCFKQINALNGYIALMRKGWIK